MNTIFGRRTNTNQFGSGFDRNVIVATWQKARIVPGYDPSTLRKDACGAWIALMEYGKTTDNGWEIDHIHPVSKGGGDEHSNLQPLQWQNNRHKGDDYPHWTCAVSAKQ